MAYEVLARKWRPQRFDEIVGQEHITRTLQNAITQQRVGHAYLFVGPRGIGKTTSARIFAKALNCETGVVTEPCGQCESCRQIASGNSLDVIEIDGASHNKVEDIRDLRDNVQYTPARSRFKIYIIDEVHMLSNAAWNALLKTLEEPPPHVKFFFATTEPHKVLPTIISRCQRFDLKRIPVGLIAARLRDIAKAENIAINERALTAIARAADGGMRDAQSIFDQIIAFCSHDADTEITEDDVIDVFGLASGSELTQLADALLGDSLPDAVRVVQHLADRGRDLERLYADLVFFLRNVMIRAVCPKDDSILDLSESEAQDIDAVVGHADPLLVQRILQGLVESEALLRNALNKRIYLEVVFVRVMRDAHSLQVNDVIDRLNRIRNGESVPNPPGYENQEPAGPTDDQLESAVPCRKPENLEPAVSCRKPENLEPAVPCRKPDAAPPPEPKRESAPSDPSDPSAPSDPSDPSDQTASLWHKLIELVANSKNHYQLKNYMQELKPVAGRYDGILQIAFDEDCPQEHVAVINQPENMAFLNEELHKLTGNPGARILVKRWTDGLSNETQKRRLVSSPEVRAKVEKDPFVQDVLDLFGGDIIDVRG